MVNKVILVGRLGRDPELRYTPKGQAVANFTMATNEVWRNQEGERQERTEWHRIVVWGKTAEFSGNYLAKGRQVYVEGRLQTREWEDRDGNKRWTTEIVAQTLQLLGSRRDAEGPSADTDFGPGPSDDGSGSESPPDSGAKESDIPF